MNRLKLIYMLPMLLLIGCVNSTSKHTIGHESHESHDTHDPLIRLTRFSGDYELFMEFSPLVMGQKSVFSIHVTNLSNYKPVSTGQLTISLIKGQKGIRHTVDNPANPGVFRPALLPGEVGLYRLKVDLTNESELTTFEFNDITVYENLDYAIYELEEQGDKERIHFQKEQAWKTEFSVSKLSEDNFREVIHTSGQILPASGDETTVVAPFSGIINFNKILLEGKYVKRHEVLLSLSGQGIGAENILVHFSKLKSDFNEARANYTRSEKLYEDKIVSEKDFLRTKKEYEQTKVAYENVSSSGDENINSIQANMDGYIKEVKVSDGQYVEAGSPLLIIAKNKNLILRADVSQHHWHCLPDISEANFSTTYNPEIFNTKELQGRLVSYSHNATTSSWSTPVYFEISNSRNLISGSYVEVYLLSRLISGVIAIPKSALIEEQGNFFVFVQLGGESYEKRLVRLGIENGREVEVTKGLHSGEIIVTKGAYQVKLASMSSSLPSHGHNH